MYLTSLTIQNFRRIRKMKLDLTHDGDPRMWTVLIGENGTGKSSVLQAIALAAAGVVRANRLAASSLRQLPSRLSKSRELCIQAEFQFAPGRQEARRYPGYADRKRRPKGIKSELSLREGYSDLKGRSQYTVHDWDKVPIQLEDPLSEARSQGLPHWFVAGYGVSRTLPESIRHSKGDWRSTTERLRPLFDAVDLLALSFARELDDELAEAFRQALNAIVRHQKVIPKLVDVHLSDKGATSTDEIVDRYQVTQQVSETDTLSIPASELSHGFQSSLAWVADLVGHLILEAGKRLRHEEMEGLVLIDEIDLYLHPAWQVNLLAALRETFPNLQFIATTHSPILLSGLMTHEVLQLAVGADGDVRAETPDFDPRLLTGTQLYKRFFDVGGLHPSGLGDKLIRYGFLAANPYRTDAEEAEARSLLKELQEQQIDPGLVPVDRRSR